MSLHKKARADHEKFARRRMEHPDEAQDKALIRKELSNVKITPKRKKGGKVKGHKPVVRLDKRARGGHLAKKPGLTIVIEGGNDQAKEQMAAQHGMQVGAALGARKAAMAMQGGAPRAPMPPSGPMPTPNGPMRPGMARGGAC